MKKRDEGFDELLDLLKKNPGVIREIMFHPEKILPLLKTRAGRRLARDSSTRQFLDYMRSPADGLPLAFCYGGTQSLCGKGTMACVGSTKPSPNCPGNTRIDPNCPGNTRFPTS